MVYQELHHVDGSLSATQGILSFYINMKGPKVAAFPEDTMAAFDVMRAAHADLPIPERTGRSISIRRKPA